MTVLPLQIRFGSRGAHQGSYDRALGH